MSAVTIAQRTDFTMKAAQLADCFVRRPPSSPIEFPSEPLRLLTDAGLLAISLPASLGGSGVGLAGEGRAELLSVLREVGRGNLPLGRLYEGHVNALLLLHTFSSPRQMSSVAKDVLHRGYAFGVWNTGPPGSPQIIPTAAGRYRMSGSKTFATGAGRIQRAIVTASLPEGGWQMCLIPVNEVELRLSRDAWHPLGMEASESFTVDFSGIELSKQALIGKPGDYYAEPAFTSGAFRYCAVQLGAAQALFDACKAFLAGQRRAEDPFQLQRVAEMAVLLESGRHWIYQAEEWLAGGTPARSLMVRSQMMRIATEQICTRLIQLVEISVGARGLARAEPVARMLRDLQMYLRQAGFDEAFQLVGRDQMREQPSL